MDIRKLETMVQISEVTYVRINKASFEELTTFLGTFSDIYSIFQRREAYKKAHAGIPAEEKAFFDRNDAELGILSRRVLALADSIEEEFKKFRTAEKPSLIGAFGSFFAAGSTGKTELVDSILKKYKATDKNIALRRAAHEGNVADVVLLVTRFGADIDSESSNGFTALDWAFFTNKMELDGAFSTLRKLGANKTLILPLVEKYKADDESECPTKDILLSRALKEGNEADIRLLVDRYKADLVKAQSILAASQLSAPSV